MKNISDILSGLGVQVPEEKREGLDREVLENYRTLADYEKQAGKLAQALEKLKTAEEGLKAFEGVDVAELKGQIAKLQEDLAKQDADYQARVADLEFDGALSQAVAGAKGRSAKAIRAFLDVEALKASKNQEADLAAALEAVKKENAYLFETEPEYVPPAGGAPSTVGSLRDAIAEKFAKEI